MNRILSQTVLLTASDERDYQLTIRIVRMIPSLNGRHFSARPSSLVSLYDRVAMRCNLRESYGVTEEDAARNCAATVEEFLETSKDI